MTEQVKPLLVSLGQHKAEVLERLARSIRTGQDWDDLARALAHADAAYQEGDIARDTVEDLARWAAALSRQIPQGLASSAGGDIPAEVLLAGPDEPCPCCGRTEWWNRAGQTLCCTCHPLPVHEDEDRVAA